MTLPSELGDGDDELVRHFLRALFEPFPDLTRIDFASLLPRVKAFDSGLIGATKTQKHEDPPSGRAGVPANRGRIDQGVATAILPENLAERKPQF